MATESVKVFEIVIYSNKLKQVLYGIQYHKQWQQTVINNAIKNCQDQTLVLINNTKKSLMIILVFAFYIFIKKKILAQVLFLVWIIDVLKLYYREFCLEQKF